MKESVTLAVRHYFSMNHILSAAHFARLSSELERSNVGKTTGDLQAENIAYVTGCVFCSVAFLEGTINEFFRDCVDNPSVLAMASGDNMVKLMAGMWNLGVPRTARYSILEKYQIALMLGRKELFHMGKQPYQDIKCLVELRNALTHYEPETTTAYSDEGPVDVQKLGKRLNRRFPVSPLATGPLFFPNKCLGHGCAKWAVTSVVGFAEEFFAKMGISLPFDHLRPQLNPE
jgi:hypothetical protein